MGTTGDLNPGLIPAYSWSMHFWRGDTARNKVSVNLVSGKDPLPHLLVTFLRHLVVERDFEKDFPECSLSHISQGMPQSSWKLHFYLLPTLWVSGASGCAFPGDINNLRKNGVIYYRQGFLGPGLCLYLDLVQLMSDRLQCACPALGKSYLLGL